MKRYIEKDRILAEIEKKKIPFKKDIEDGVYPTYLCALMDFEDFISAIETKNVDLNKEDAVVIEGICSDKDFIDTNHGILAFGAEEGSYRPFNDGDKVKIIIIRKE